MCCPSPPGSTRRRGGTRTSNSATFQTFHTSNSNTPNFPRRKPAQSAAFTPPTAPKKIPTCRAEEPPRPFFFNSHLLAELSFKAPTSLTLALGGRRGELEEKHAQRLLERGKCEERRQQKPKKTKQKQMLTLLTVHPGRWESWSSPL